MWRTRIATLTALAALAALCLPAHALASHSTVELVSTGLAGGNGAVDVEFSPFGAPGAKLSRDGASAFFRTRESLVAADTDSSIDLYEHSAGTTTLVSTGPDGGNGAFDVSTAFEISDDGTHAFFHTAESLAAGDGDGSVDVYERSGATTAHVSSATNDDGAFDAALADVSDDGSRVYFKTSEPLAGADTDAAVDLYEHSAGATTLVSSASSSSDVGRVNASGDGSVVAWEQFRIYVRSTGMAVAIAPGPPCFFEIGTGTICLFDSLDGVSDDGSRVFFSTVHTWGSEDGDVCYTDDDGFTYGCYDIYEYSAGGHTQVSLGDTGDRPDFEGAYFGAASADGTHVFFSSYEPYTTGDTDGCCLDVFERSGGTTKLVSTGPASGGPAFAEPVFRAISRDGSRVFFDTEQSLVTQDTDARLDVYERSSGTTTALVSTGPADNGDAGAAFVGASEDGTRVFFSSGFQFVPADTDGAVDIYERAAGVTEILPSGTTDSHFVDASAGAREVMLRTRDSMIATDTDFAWDVYATSIAPPTPYPRPGGATPLYVPLVPAFRECTSPNSQHAGPLAAGSCAPPALQSTLLTTSSVGRGGGLARFDVVVGDPGLPGDQADVHIGAFATDVRLTAGGDYTGKLIMNAQLRLTDRASGSAESTSATVQDAELSLPVDCVATPDPARGSDCRLDASLDALVPGFAQEGRRAIAALEVGVEDAGPDDAVGASGCPPTCGTGDESPYLTQGVFTP